MLNTESESMTIKRLEIALRKMDLVLLKTAAYKLHEKFHSGYKFEYLEELGQILSFLEEQDTEDEIFHMVTSTIKEILQKDVTVEVKEKAEVFTPLNKPEPVYYSQPQTNKKIGIFYEEKDVEIDSRLIREHKKLVASNAPIGDVLANLKMVLNILNADLSSLNKILSAASTLKNDIDLITTSMNSNLLKQMKNNSIDFIIPDVHHTIAPNPWNVLPIYGGTNIFECKNCENIFLNTNYEQKSFVMQCPKCSEVSYPQLNLNSSLSGKIIQKAFDSLLNSKVWVLINPPQERENQDLLALAYKNSTPERIYLLSQDGERKEFFRQMFYKINQNCEIKGNFLSAENFCEEFIKSETMMGVCV